jgi:conjugative transfer signal peptidase TraF
MEIVNQVMLAGNLTEQPTVSDAGGRQFVRARLAQHWNYDTQGRTVEHRQFLPITFSEKAPSSPSLSRRATTSTSPVSSSAAKPERGQIPRIQAATAVRSSRSTSFGPSESRQARGPSQRLFTKTKSAVQTTPNKNLHSFRKVSMTGPFSHLVSSGLLTLSRQRNIVVASAAAFVFAALTAIRFGLVFNYTHSAPFGMYREIPEPASMPRHPAPYVFFCPDVRWPAMKGQPNYRTPMRTCPDGFAPLIKPVIAWPGDTVETSAGGVAVNGHLLPHTATMDRDSSRRQILPFPAGKYLVQKNQLWVASSFSPRSFDSRYFGPIPLNSVRSWIRPLLVERSYHPSSDSN